ncbi:hypothetical protein [Ochrobactrum sp. AN78]|uniref:hypothetical protein n=1 Tax=Ochrobactrum sp. AN78 TaxID=3039853 RepID=UPI002989D829|nr:hypothetical protein [Ochrobactrum sp. AN78]
MAFRADEAMMNGYERAKSYLVSRNFVPDDRARSERALQDIIDDCGPVVDGYPTWHPLVSHQDEHNPGTYPSDRCGYQGLDHTVYFAHGFLTCPYVDAEKVVASAHTIPHHPRATISAEILDVPFYNTGTQPVLVRCEWDAILEPSKMVPKSLAVPLMLEQELPVWRWSSRAESWETMRPYLLGAPHGSRSSLFVSQETALAMKKVYLAMVESGMFGPVKTG